MTLVAIGVWVPHLCLREILELQELETIRANKYSCIVHEMTEGWVLPILLTFSG